MAAFEEWKYRRFVNHENCALLHAHFGNSGLYWLPYTRKAALPQITTFHGFDASSKLRQPDYRKGLTGLFRNSHVVAVSDYMKKCFREEGLDTVRCHVIRYGIPSHEYPFRPRPPLGEKARKGERIRCLQVSGFGEKKGHFATLEAFAKVQSVYPNMELVFVGDGPLKEKAKEVAAKWGVGDLVHFLGAMPFREAALEMDKADLFVHHSVTARNGDKEGIPNAIMEAMMCGLPLISTRHAGIPEIIEEDRTGYLVDELDLEEYVSVWKKALFSCVSIGIEAHGYAQRELGVERQTKDILELYERILGKSQKY
jgi:glycosyltransferase involved in cell wall biosynthesis